MKTASAALVNTLKQDLSISTGIRVIAEWNHNRYTPISEVNNFGRPEATYGQDLDLFPIESITEPLRPISGLVVARVGDAVISHDGDNPNSPRYYVPSVDNIYKYWSSPEASTNVPYAGGGWTISNCMPCVIYTRPASTNKIFMCVERTATLCQKYDVQVSVIDGNDWTTVASDVSIQPNGTMALYRQANGSWSTNVYRDNPTNLIGVRIVVHSINIAFKYFDLIELGLRLESNLSDMTISFGTSGELSDSDEISPLGQISSNTGSLVLSNFDGRFNNDPPEGVDPIPTYRGLCEANVKFTVDNIIDATPHGGGLEYTRLATMYVDGPWQGTDWQVNLSLKDASTFLQQIKPLQQLIEDASIGQIIWRMLEGIGFTDYIYSSEAETTTSNVRFFWTNPDDTIWDNIQEVCRTTQSAAWFDEYGMLNIKTRNSAMNNLADPDWTLDGELNGSKQPDIASLELNGQYEANSVVVHYKPTDLVEDTEGRPITEEMWRPDDDIVLRASSLVRPMSDSAMSFWLSSANATIWPFSGMVNIGGELIKYDGKPYKYYTQAGPVTTTIHSLDEQKQIDSVLSSDEQRYLNSYTGELIVTERGFDYTSPAAHDSDIGQWLFKGGYITTGASQTAWNGGLKLLKEDSILRLQTNATFNASWYSAYRTELSDTTYRYFGTRLRFPSSPKGGQAVAGIMFWATSNREQYYGVEVAPTAYIDDHGYRSTRNEVRVIKKNADETLTVVSGGNGHASIIPFDHFVDLDVVAVSGAINVYFGGQLVLTANDPSPLPQTGRCGVYVRGFTVADFEYFYASGPNSIEESDLDNQAFFDIVQSDYYSNQFYKDNLWQVRTVKKRRGKKTVLVKDQYRTRVFDEFGTYVHEVRDYDVKFDDKIGVWSDLYTSNDTQIVLDEYVHSPAGAKFRIANASRFNAVINGDDALTYGPDNVVSQQTFIYGRTIHQADDKIVTVKDDSRIRARGAIELEIESDWIQSEGAAQELADWTVANWSEAADEITVDVFGNPLFQVGDVVAINFAPRGFTEDTHRYFILSIDHEWENGLTTTLQLRRARLV